MDAGTKLIGLFGHPVEHTLSPLFMNEALAALGVNCIYLAFDVEEDRIGAAVHALRHLKWSGANVTIPHKQAVMDHLDLLDNDARLIGAVNCIVNREGSLRGHNTDHLGFRTTLEDRAFHFRESDAAIIGCGGAARGILYALVKAGIRKVFLINRTESRALELIGWAESALSFGRIEYIGDGKKPARGSALRAAVEASSLVVNTTPVGMYPSVGESPLEEGVNFRPGALVYDLIYNPWKTELLKRAQGRGAAALNGLPMLILQGLHSLALWFPDRSREVFTLEKRLLRRAVRALRVRPR